MVFGPQQRQPVGTRRKRLLDHICRTIDKTISISENNKVVVDGFHMEWKEFQSDIIEIYIKAGWKNVSVETYHGEFDDNWKIILEAN